MLLYFPCPAHVDFLPSRSMVYTFVIILSLLTSQVRTTSDLALLTASLRTFQKHACDGEELRLECPFGTVISISLAQYGRPFLPSSFSGIEPCPPEEEYKWKGGGPGCFADNALKVIEKTCREQRVCRLWTSPETFQEDPCPGVRKFAEVAYKCRPDQFKNRVICDGGRLRLNCDAGFRIIIYSASFGSVKEGVIECPQPSGVDDEDCMLSYSTEHAIRVCGSRRKCSLAADVHAFGSPLCNPKIRKHLKVISTCVPQEVVTPSPFGIDYEEEEEGNLADSTRYDYPMPVDLEPSRTRSGASTTHTVTRNPWRSMYTNTTIKKLEMQNDEISNEEPPGESNRSDQRVVGLIAQWISANKFIAGNKEKLILYVTVSLGVGLLIFLSVVGIKLFHLRVLSRKKHKVSKSQEQFPDDNSDFEPDERPPSRHPSRISVRRQDSDVQPRTPVTSDANHYYI